MKKVKNDGGRYGFGRYFLLWIAFSFFGWVLEVVVLYLERKAFVNRGFLSFPICPIYGTSIVGAYLLLGSLAEPRGVFARIKSRGWHAALYVLVVFILPTLVELLTGLVLEKGLHVCMWSYGHMPYNLGGYVCLPISIGWGIGLFLCLQVAFPPLKKLIGKLPRGFCLVLSVLLGVLIGAEFVQRIYEVLQR